MVIQVTPGRTTCPGQPGTVQGLWKEVVSPWSSLVFSNKKKKGCIGTSDSTAWGGAKSSTLLLAFLIKDILSPAVLSLEIKKHQRLGAIGDWSTALKSWYCHLTNLFDKFLLFRCYHLGLSWTTWQTSACLEFGALPGFSLQQSISAIMAMPQLPHHSSCDSKILEKLYFLLTPIMEKKQS